MAGKGEGAARAVWATGEVDRDLNVGVVEHVAEKVRQSAGLFTELAEAGIPLTLVVPRANLEEVGPLPEGCDVVAADHARDLYRVLGLERPAVAPGPRKADHGAAKGALTFIAVVAVLVAAALGVAAWQAGEMLNAARKEKDALRAGATTESLVSHPEKAEPPVAAPPGPAPPGPGPAAPELSLRAVEIRIPRFHDCRRIEAGTLTPQVKDLPPADRGAFRSSHPSGLCWVRYAVHNEGAPAHVRIRVLQEGGGRGATRPLSADGMLGAGESVSVKVPFPSWQRDARVLHVLAVAGTAPLDEVRTRIDGTNQADDLESLRTRLEKAGLWVSLATHRIAR